MDGTVGTPLTETPGARAGAKPWPPRRPTSGMPPLEVLNTVGLG